MNLVDYYLLNGRPVQEKRFLESFMGHMSRHEFYEMMKTYHKIFGGKVDVKTININQHFDMAKAYEIGEGHVDVYTRLNDILGED